ncbi:MAG: hypothetical protein JXA36_01685 [Coriobacteriia bacterium]|nr:hypothetical protein [Coriobacteriia bacterium]
MEAQTHRVPDFGPVIRRKHLLQVFRNQRPEMTVICAPAGYGKSVLAAQLAHGGSFDRVIWIPLYDTDVRDDEWLVNLAFAVRPLGPSDSRGVPAQLPAGSVSRADAMLRIREGLRSCNDEAVCLVLDGCNRVSDLQAFEEVAGLLRRSCQGSSRLVVTCRSVADCDYAPDAARTWAVDEYDLRFQELEIVELMTLMGVTGIPEEDACRILDRFSGHPALTSLVLRHDRLDDSVDPPRDLVWHTQRLVSQLPDSVMQMLYVAAILREGSATEIADCLPPGGFEPDWVEAQAASPLFTILKDGALLPIGFRMHAVLSDAIVHCVPERMGEELAGGLRGRVLALLHHSGDYVRLSGALVSACGPDEIAEWCELCGSQVLHFVGPAALERCLNRVPPGRVSSSSRLLLLRAAVLREQERWDEAMTHATLSRRLAENAGDGDVLIQAVLLTGRLALDVVEPDRARDMLLGLMDSVGQRLDAASECQCQGYLAAIEILVGDAHSALSHAARVYELMDSLANGSPEVVLTANCMAGAEGVGAGRWDRAAAVLSKVLAEPIQSPLQRVQCVANLAVAYLELGMIDQSRALLQEALPDTEEAGLQHMRGYALGTLSDLLNAAGECEAAQAAHLESQQILNEKDDTFGASVAQLSAAVARRALGYREESLALAESAFAGLRDNHSGMRLVISSVETEIAASLLSLGDTWGARRIAGRIRADLEDSGACAHLLRSDMVLAEVDRTDGAIPDAVARLATHAEYIATGSANYLAAMYIRAFPGLLGLLASATGAENLPLRMLRLLPEETLEAALALPESFLRPEDMQIARSRVTGASASSSSSPDDVSETPEHTCYVRLFGGLEVTTEAGIVDEADWRKRKARLLFAMLVARQRQDLPRDMITERLWPEMDEDQAKRNFYVTWSTMKRALACGSAPAQAAHLVQCSGGLCRLTRAVRSDLDDFDEAVTRLRTAAVVRDDAGVLSAARELAGIYTGELLPGDIYEEWFSDVRERTKHDFCDAMMVAAHKAEALSEFDTALLHLRRASAADPWREDVYQAMMRCQMSAGQRSRAIETYISCRLKLTEDLGIDPSAETTRLYQAVLAMEETGR